MFPEIVEEPTYSYPTTNLQQAIISYISYSQEVKSKKIDAEILKDFSTLAKKAINFSDNWLKEATFSNSADELKRITQTTLDNFKEYFEEKLSSQKSHLIYYVSDIELLNIHKQIYQIGNISDQGDEDLEKKAQLQILISSANFKMELKSGESNILHYPRQFFGKNTVKFILEKIPEEIFLHLTQHKLIADISDPLNNLNPLQIAIHNKDQEMLSLFLDLKFNHQNQASSQPPLNSSACRFNREETAKLLIEKGAKITDDCFKIAIKTKNKDILNLLIRSEMKKSGKTKLEVLKKNLP